VEVGRRFAAQALEQLRTAAHTIQLVHVLHDEHEIAGKPLREGLGEKACCHLDAETRVRVGVGPASRIARQLLRQAR